MKEGKEAVDYTFIDDDGMNLEQSSAVRKKEPSREEDKPNHSFRLRRDVKTNKLKYKSKI